MAKIKELNFTIDNSSNPLTIIVNTNNIPKNIVLKKAIIPLQVLSFTAGKQYNVEFWLNGAKQWVTDRIFALTNGQNLDINITDELQNAVDQKQSQLQFKIVDDNGDSSGIALMSQSLANDKTLYSIEYISKAEYQENGSSHNVDIGSAGQANVSLNTGVLALTHTDTQSDNNVLPISISHVYNSNGTQMPNADCIKNYCGNGWKLNIEQYLIEKTETVQDNGTTKEIPTGQYEYIDENGKRQHIVEKYYYYDAFKTKRYVDRNDPNVLINLNGKLQYNNGDEANPNLVDLNSEWDAPSGLKLVTSKKDIKGANLVDDEPDELIQLQDQIKSLELNKLSIENSIKTNKKQLISLVLSKRALEYELSLQDLSIKSSIDEINFLTNTQEYQTTIKNKMPSSTDYETANKMINAENYTKTYTEAQTESYSGTKRLQTQMLEKNKQLYWDNLTYGNFKQLIQTELSAESINNVFGTENIDAKLQEFFKELFEIDENGNVNFEISKIKLSDKDYYTIDLQIESVVSSIELYNFQLSDIIAQLKKCYNQEVNYQRQIPSFYLYNESAIYGFSPIILEKEVNNTETKEIEYTEVPHIYRLNCILDNYENSVVINYNKNTNKIENIIDSQNGVISFDYKFEKLSNIIDAQERKISFTYKDNTLISMTYNDGTQSKFVYDNSDKLVGAVGNNGLGAKFTYENNRVVRINELSILSADDGDYVLNDNLFTYSNLSVIPASPQYVTFDYKNYLSTTISSMKLINNVATTEKSLTYVFDNLGRVRTVYENAFDESNPNASIPVVKAYDYESNTKQITAEPLLNSKNYMDDVCFEGQAVVSEPVNYLSNGITEGETIYCGDDVYCEQHLVHKEYHSFDPDDTGADKLCKSLRVSVENIRAIKTLQPTNIGSTWLMLGGWAKADSAFVFNPDNDGAIGAYPQYIQQRKFELRVKVTYSNFAAQEFSKCFDWMNTDWQYCALPVPIKNNADLESIECYFDYSNNINAFTQSNGTTLAAAFFTDLTLKEVSFEEKTFSNKLLQDVTSSHSKWKQLYTYDENDKLISIEYGDLTRIRSEKFINHFYYNKNGKLFKAIDYRGLVTEKVYDDYGAEIKTLTYHKDNPSEILYGEQKRGEKGEVLADYNELGEETGTYSYLKGTGIVSSIADKQGSKTSYGYDPLNGTLLQMTSDVDGNSNTNTYGYDLGFLTKVSHNDFDISYEYDSFGRVSKIKVAGRDYLTFDYDESQNSTVSTYSNSQSFKTVSDKDGNIIEVYYKKDATTDEPSPEYTLLLENIYDTHGNLIATNDKITNTTRTYTLDKFGNATLVADTQHGCVVQKENTFDSNNNNTYSKITIGDHTIDYLYTYDNNGPQAELLSVMLPTNAVQSVTKDKLDRTKEITLSSGEKKASRHYYYLKRGDHASNLVSSLWFGDNNTLMQNLRYKYDANGNITEVYENNNFVVRYQYDSLNRIIREDNFRFRKTTTWTYDAGGNIANRKEYPYTLNDDLTHFVDEQMLSTTELQNKAYSTYKSISYTYANNGNRDRLMDYNGEQFAYDAIGNPTTYRGKQLTWENGRQLKAFGNIATYSYNANGVRIGKAFDSVTTQFYLDGTRILAQKDTINKGASSVETLMNFVYGIDGITGFALTTSSGTTNYYYKKNAQGDIIGIYDADLQEIVRYYYDAWGNVQIFYKNSDKFVDFNPENDYTITNDHNLYVALKNPFRYRSYYFDIETGLYYLNSRYYDPEIGRFINADDITVLDITNIALNGLNLYAYCLNNPVNEVDESGYILGTILALIISAVVLAVVNTAGQFVSDLITGLFTHQWNFRWEDYVGAFVGGIAGGIAFVMFGLNLQAAFGVMGMVDTLATKTLTNITGKTDYSASEIAASSIVSLIIGLAFGKGLRIAGVTAGRNNFFAVYESGLRKLMNGTASRMSAKVMMKGIVSLSTFKAIGFAAKAIIGMLDFSRLITKRR